MPVLETDFLKGLIDPTDKLHPHAVRSLDKIRTEKWRVASSAFIELDLILKNIGIAIKERIEIFEGLKSEIPLGAILEITHSTMSEAAQLQDAYKFTHFYFDSIHLAVAKEFDEKIVSSDESFDEIKEVRRIPLERV